MTRGDELARLLQVLAAGLTKAQRAMWRDWPDEGLHVQDYLKPVAHWTPSERRDYLHDLLATGLVELHEIDRRLRLTPLGLAIRNILKAQSDATTPL